MTPFFRTFFSSFLSLISVASLCAGFDHSKFDAFLESHVERGLVDYEAAAHDARLSDYLKELAAADLSQLQSREEQLAFWINAYNAYTIDLVASAYPVKSIRLISEYGKSVDSIKDAKPWKVEFAVVAGETYSLDHIEHEILLKGLQEPRVHFAIVCGALSCPILRSEAYTAEKLEEQFLAQGHWFFSWRNQFDLETKTAGLSKILKWFEADFGGSQEAVLRFASDYVSGPLAESLAKEPEAWTVKSQFYDWKLNEKK